MTDSADNQSNIYQLSENDKLLDSKCETKISSLMNCERLTKARKSLTRCKSIEESIDAIAENNISQNESVADNGKTSPVKNMENLESSQEKMILKQSSIDSRMSHNLDLENNKEREPDNISASLSVIKMEKFALEKRRVSRILPRCLHRTFVDPDVEHLFQVYHKRQRRADLPLLFVSGILLAFYTIIRNYFQFDRIVTDKDQSIGSDNETYEMSYYNIIILVMCSIMQFVMIFLCQKLPLPDYLYGIFPFGAVLLNTLELLILVLESPSSVTPTYVLLWIILLVFLIFVVLPLRLPVCFGLAMMVASLLLATTFTEVQMITVREVCIFYLLFIINKHVL